MHGTSASHLRCAEAAGLTLGNNCENSTFALAVCWCFKARCCLLREEPRKLCPGSTSRGFLDKPGASLGKELAQAGVVVPGVGIPCVRGSLLQSPIQAGDAISVPGKLSFGGLTPETGSHFEEKRAAGVGPSVRLSIPTPSSTPLCSRIHHTFFVREN